MTVDSLVRPVVTLLFAISQVALGAAWALGMEHAEPAFAAMSAFTMAVVIYWFKERTEAKRTDSGAGG